MGEQTDYLSLLNYRKKYKLRDPYYDFTVMPISFNTKEKREMLLNIKELLDAEMVAINPDRHNNLVLALRTAQTMDMILDKDITSNNDILDAFSLACKRIFLNRKEVARFADYLFNNRSFSADFLAVFYTYFFFYF